MATSLSDDYQEEAHCEWIYNSSIVKTKGQPQTTSITSHLEGQLCGGRKSIRSQADTNIDGGCKCTICQQHRHNRQTCFVALDTGHWLRILGLDSYLLLCMSQKLLVMWHSQLRNEVIESYHHCWMLISLWKLIWHQWSLEWLCPSANRVSKQAKYCRGVFFLTGGSK
jgi:hypothetical protein